MDLQPREGLLSEVNVIGCTVDEAITRVEKFLDESTVTDQQRSYVSSTATAPASCVAALAAFLKEHPLVAKFDSAPQQSGRRRGNSRGIKGLMQFAKFQLLGSGVLIDSKLVNGSVSSNVHRRPETPGGHRRGDPGLRVAEEERGQLQGALSVSRREDAVVSASTGTRGSSTALAAARAATSSSSSSSTKRSGFTMR